MIDIHTHVSADNVDSMPAIMDACHVEMAVIWMRAASRSDSTASAVTAGGCEMRSRDYASGERLRRGRALACPCSPLV